jgi:hypothetical protein
MAACRRVSLEHRGKRNSKDGMFGSVDRLTAPRGPTGRAVENAVGCHMLMQHTHETHGVLTGVVHFIVDLGRHLLSLVLPARAQLRITTCSVRENGTSTGMRVHAHMPGCGCIRCTAPARARCCGIVRCRHDMQEQRVQDSESTGPRDRPSSSSKGLFSACSTNCRHPRSTVQPHSSVSCSGSCTSLKSNDERLWMSRSGLLARRRVGDGSKSSGIGNKRAVQDRTSVTATYL